MSNQSNRTGTKSNAAPERKERLKPRSHEEARVWEALEKARQNVKPIVKMEKEAEVLSEELLSLRLTSLW